MVRLVTTALFVFAATAAASTRSYEQQRAALLSVDNSTYLGADLLLSAAELRVDAVIRSARAADLALSEPPIPALPFSASRGLLEGGALLPLLRSMPKGAALHLHADSIVDPRWLVSDATYEPGLWVCGALDGGGGAVAYRFAALPDPPTLPCDGASGWRSVAALRSAASDAAAFDATLLRTLVLSTEPFATLSAVWRAFDGCIGAAGGLIFYEPVHTRYLAEALDSFLKDGVSLIEVRQLLQGDIGRTYELDGTLNSAEHTVRKWADAGAAAAEARGLDGGHPLVRVIVCGLRSTTEGGLQALHGAEALFEALPAVVAGFDLVGQEDPGQPLTAFVPALLNRSSDASAMPLILHAGETNVVGEAAGLNLADALLLNSTRLGHGYALARHPGLRAEAKRRGIAVEVCPISNQVLDLVDDLRNHPLHTLLSEGLSVVLSSDDPAIWHATPGVSFDWAVAFLAMDSRAGLGTLKQLAINSLKHSSLPSTNSAGGEKQAALAEWGRAWDRWVSETDAAAAVLLARAAAVRAAGAHHLRGSYWEF